METKIYTVFDQKEQKLKMKRKTLAMIITGIICCLLIAGCQGTNTSPADTDIPQIEQEEEEAPSETIKTGEKGKKGTDDEFMENRSEKTALTKEQCEEEIELLKGSEPVQPDYAEILKDMMNCATTAGAVDKQGELFLELDNDQKARLRYRFLEAVMWPNSSIYEDIAAELDNDEWGVTVEDATGLFKDAYGDGEFTPAENERVENGYIIPIFGDGEPVDLVDPVRFFEDKDYILLEGPMFYESNGEGELFEGYADILFKKNPDSRFGATLLYGKLNDENISISSVETSSELPALGGKTYSGNNLTDKDPSTVWVEGADGVGIGEKVTLHLDRKQPVYGIQIVVGYTASYKQYSENGRPTDIEVDFGNGVIAEGHELEGYGSESFSAQDLADQNRFRVGLDEPVVTDTITVTITGAVKGEKYDDVCISEIWVY